MTTSLVSRKLPQHYWQALLRNSIGAIYFFAWLWLLMGPSHLLSPAYTNFVGSNDRFLRFGLGLGGIFASTALATPKLEERN